MSVRLAVVSLLTLVACRDRQVSETSRGPSPIETAIARDLTARFGTPTAPVTASCVMAPVKNTPVKCTAKMADGTELPIAIDNAAKDEWGWRIDGRVIEAKTLVDYVQGHLAALHVKETATCGRPIQVVAPHERVRCPLSGGGAAFVTFAADGEASIEIELTAAGAEARADTPGESAADTELTKQSKDLEGVQPGESDGEDEVVIDGGTAKP